MKKLRTALFGLPGFQIQGPKRVQRKMKEDGESISWGDYADYMEVDYNHFDAGMNIGVGVWYDRFNLDLTYQRGFIDAFSDADGFKTSNFMIRLGIAF